MCATFLQWAKNYPLKKRLLYICGEDHALVEEVLQKELVYRPLNDLDYVTLDGKRAHLADITAALDQFSKDGFRVVVLMNADAVKEWDKIIEWASSKEMKETTFICVGNDTKPETRQSRFRPFIEKGRFIECKSLSEEQLVDYVLSRGRCTKEASIALVKRTAGSSARILNELRKFEYLPIPITAETVNTYVEISESEQLVNALFENNKPLAMQIVGYLDEDTFRFIVGSLEYALTNMLILSTVQDKNASLRDIAERTSIPIFLLGKYFSWSKGVSTAMLYKRIKLLANADAANHRGISIGVFERMISLW